MNTHHLFFSFLLCLVSFTLSGQRSISGRITDAENSEPIPGVSVFLDNTTIGVSTDAGGNYRLKIPGEGSYRLVVSHVGYQSVFKDIEPGNSSVKFNVALLAIELEEVTVAVKVKSRRNDIQLFWKTILGKNPSRRTIQATNPEAVFYYYNPETQILKVTCREPLQIVNYETGYQIQYVLNYFTHNYNTDISDWRHQCSYTELEPVNKRQQKNWEKKRKEVYHVSLTKFIKSLYNNTLQNDGFVLATLHQNPDQLTILSPDSILSAKSIDNSKTLNYKNKQLILICYGRPVTAADLNMIKRTQGGDLLQSLKNSGIIMNLLHGDAIRVYPDGTYTEKLHITPVNTTISLADLSMRLPLDYAEDATVSGNESVFDIIAQYFKQQLSVFPQEKIHLHTDRDFYVPGEKIWFRAYLTDAATHQHSTQSRYVYVELISPVDTLVRRVMIHPENGMFYGHLPLTELIPEGNYTLRAYTRYM